MEKLLLDFTMSDSGIGVQYAPRTRAKLVTRLETIVQQYSLKKRKIQNSKEKEKKARMISYFDRSIGFASYDKS